MSRRIFKTLSTVLAVLMLVAAFSPAALAKPISSAAVESRALKLMDTTWAELDKVEAQMMALGASSEEVTMAVYKAALTSNRIDKGSISDLDDNGFSFKVKGMACGYDYKIRNTPFQSSVNAEVVDGVVSKITSVKNGVGSANVLLVAPWYASDTSFTDQYKTEAQSIATATGGTYTLIKDSNATGPAITAAYLDKGVVIYDSHGAAYNSTSYLCLTTSTGLTTTDYNNGWAYNGGSWYGIDGRYVKNHVTGTLSNCLVWMAICEGMKLSGGGVTGTGLLAAGAGCVYGYSQSVSFTGDYKYEAKFWTEMKNGSTVKAAIKVMKDTYGVPDPVSGGDAYPIVMSPLDAYPSNPDGAQTVYCDLALFGGTTTEPVAITSATLAAVNVVVGATATASLTVQPTSNTDYTVSYSSSKTSVATVNSSTGVVTGVAAGTATLTATIVDNAASTTLTRTATITVTDAPHYTATNDIVVGDQYLIGFVVNNNVYLLMNYNPSPITSGNNYYYSSSSNYYGYTALATKSGDSIVGCSGWASDLQYCLWTFSSTTGGKINSCYNTSYNLAIYNSTTYTDLHPSTSTSYTSWVWNSTEHTLTHVYSSSTKYASYMATVGSYSNFCYAPTTKTSANSYVQLYKLGGTVVEPTYYTVTFVDYDGTVLSTQSVAEGASATAPTNPSRTGYTFAGWNGSYTNVTANVTITATYTINTYTVTFVDWDGTTISTQTVNYGGSATAPADPTRTGYVFAGWSGTYTNVTANVTITATYTENTTPSTGSGYLATDTIVVGDQYLIGFVVNGNVYLIMNYNPSPITSSNNYYYNSSSNYYGYTAQAVMNGEYITGVTGWTTNLQHCLWTFSTTTGGRINSVYNTSYNLAIYSSTSYTDLHPSTSTSYSSWIWNASAHTLTHAYSSSTKYASYMATAGSYSNFCYAPTSKTSSNSYVQLYKYVDNGGTTPVTYYTVTFVDWDGTVLSTQSVAEGASATAPADPTRTGYTFAGWNGTYTNVTANVTITATYTENTTPVTNGYAPVNTITVGQQYLIGFVVNGNVYLIMNYNPSPASSNSYYYSSSSNYYGYTAQAVMDGDNITGCTGWTDNLQYCLWTFTSTTGGRINSVYNTSYNLAIYNSTRYTDLHPSTSTSFSSWVWNASAHTLTHAYSSYTKYASYMATVGSYSNFCYAPTRKTTSNSYVQLYTLSTSANMQPAGVDSSVSVAVAIPVYEARA